MKHFTDTKIYMLLFAVATFMAACTTKPSAEEKAESKGISYSVEVQNPVDMARNNVLVAVSQEELFKMNLKADQTFVIEAEGKQIPNQFVENEGLLFVLEELGASETKTFTLKVVSEDSVESYPKRTQAELSIKKGGEWKGREYIGGQFENVDSLRVPDEHTDHSWYIRYEGPGWESDLVGYRFYLDWRNGVDVFGKTTHDMVLQNAGQDNFDSYHELSDWGMDIMKVGESLGVGSIASFQEGKAMRVAETDSVISKILENGAIYSAVQTDYYGWKVADKDLDLKSVISIHAGSRLSKEHLELEKNLDNIATGLNKLEDTNLFTSEGSADSYGYVATYGKQSLNNDNLGIAVLFAPNRFNSFKEDEHSHIVTLNPEGESVDYYFLAAWEKEPNGITSEEDFLTYLEKTAKELANPVNVTIKN